MNSLQGYNYRVFKSSNIKYEIMAEPLRKQCVNHVYYCLCGSTIPSRNIILSEFKLEPASSLLECCIVDTSRPFRFRAISSLQSTR